LFALCILFTLCSSFTFRRESGWHNNALAAFLSRFSTFVCLSVGGGESASSREKFFSAFSCRCAAVLIFELCGATTQRQIFFLHKHIHNTQCFGMLFAAKMHVPLRVAHSGKKRGVFLCDFSAKPRIASRTKRLLKETPLKDLSARSVHLAF
jgi:hypothetical protein